MCPVHMIYHIMLEGGGGRGGGGGGGGGGGRGSEAPFGGGPF